MRFSRGVSESESTAPARSQRADGCRRKVEIREVEIDVGRGDADSGECEEMQAHQADGEAVLLADGEESCHVGAAVSCRQMPMAG